MTKTISILRGSPRKNGNTNQLTDVVARRLMQEAGVSIRDFTLYDMHIEPCLACRACQQDWSRVNCARDDDMAQVFDAIMQSDLLILATELADAPNAFAAWAPTVFSLVMRSL